MKNKMFKKMAAVLALVTVCGFNTGCGSINMQDVLNQAQGQTEQSQAASDAQESVEQSVAAESIEASQETASTNESVAESTAESTAESMVESTAESTAESVATSTTMSGEWTDMNFELAGKTYQMPFAYKELEAEGWTFDLADYGYEDGYAMDPGDKVYATIDLTNPSYDEDLSIRVGFKNYSDSVLDIKECDIWSFEMDTCYGHKQLPSYPSMTIGNGLTIGSSKSDVEALCGPYDDIYESDSGYVKYTYNADDYTLKITVYEGMGTTCFELSTYE